MRLEGLDLSPGFDRLLQRGRVLSARPPRRRWRRRPQPSPPRLPRRGRAGTSGTAAAGGLLVLLMLEGVTHLLQLAADLAQLVPLTADQGLGIGRRLERLVEVAPVLGEVLLRLRGELDVVDLGLASVPLGFLWLGLLLPRGSSAALRPRVSSSRRFGSLIFLRLFDRFRFRGSLDFGAAQRAVQGVERPVLPEPLDERCSCST